VNVLVIGGAGYIGSHVAQACLDHGHAVTVFDNLSSGLRDNIGIESGFIEADILDVDALNRAVRGDGGTGEPFDAVIHLAAFKAAGESMTLPEKYAENNICGTIQILNAMARAGVRSFVFSSSAAVYGEPEYLPVDEEHPCTPTNFYGFSKLEIERLLSWYERIRSIRHASLRYFNAAGYDVAGRIHGLERNPANLIPVVMETAVGMREEVLVFGDDYSTDDGTGVRDYIHVTDLAEAHVRALEYIARTDQSLTVNLGSERGLSVNEILAAARRITGTPIPSRVVDRRPGDPARLVASATRAREILGWNARYSDLDTLVSTSWAAYRAQGT
jgi:UDP-glucose 4-epimerase